MFRWCWVRQLVSRLSRPERVRQQRVGSVGRHSFKINYPIPRSTGGYAVDLGSTGRVVAPLIINVAEFRLGSVLAG
jgi:hypothetical protein